MIGRTYLPLARKGTRSRIKSDNSSDIGEDCRERLESNFFDKERKKELKQTILRSVIHDREKMKGTAMTLTSVYAQSIGQNQFKDITAYNV